MQFNVYVSTYFSPRIVSAFKIVALLCCAATIGVGLYTLGNLAGRALPGWVGPALVSVLTVSLIALRFGNFHRVAQESVRKRTSSLEAQLRSEQEEMTQLLLTSLQTPAERVRPTPPQDGIDNIIDYIQALHDHIDRRDRRNNRAQWAFFAAGILLSVPVGILVNRLS